MIWFLLFSLLVVQAAAQTKCICYQELNINLGAVTEIEASPDSSGRLFLCEQAGTVRIMDDSDTLLPEPFLNISVAPQGLLSIAFHPDFVNNQRLYVYYASGIQDIMRLSEFTTDTSNPNLADMTSERMLANFSADQERPGHTGGDLLFGLDKMLYLSLGDGGFATTLDPVNNAQNKSNPYGGVIRIDVDSRTGDLEYGIPPDNPFLSDPEAINNTELYALGLRNAWRMTMDFGNRTTTEGRGRIFIADVGEDSYEELDLLQPAANYGWAAREGPECLKDLLNCPERPVCVTDATETCPILYYNRTVGGSIIGGHVYRGCVNTDYDGWYIFADYKFPALYRALETSPSVWEMDEIPTCASCIAQNFIGKPYTIGMDANGELYMSTAQFGQHVYRLYDPTFVGQLTCPLP